MHRIFTSHGWCTSGPCGGVAFSPAIERRRVVVVVRRRQIALGPARTSMATSSVGPRPRRARGQPARHQAQPMDMNDGSTNRLIRHHPHDRPPSAPDRDHTHQAQTVHGVRPCVRTYVPPRAPAVLHGGKGSRMTRITPTGNRAYVRRCTTRERYSYSRSRYVPVVVPSRYVQ